MNAKALPCLPTMTTQSTSSEDQIVYWSVIMLLPVICRVEGRSGVRTRPTSGKLSHSKSNRPDPLHGLYVAWYSSCIEKSELQTIQRLTSLPAACTTTRLRTVVEFDYPRVLLGPIASLGSCNTDVDLRRHRMKQDSSSRLEARSPSLASTRLIRDCQSIEPRPPDCNPLTGPVQPVDRLGLPTLKPVAEAHGRLSKQAERRASKAAQRASPSCTRRAVPRCSCRISLCRCPGWGPLSRRPAFLQSRSHTYTF